MPRPRRELPFQGPGLDEREEAPEAELAAASEPDDAPEPEPPEEFSPETFLLICDAPRDGTVLQVKTDPDDPDDRAIFAIWRSTTMFDREMRRWKRVGYWADPITKRQLDGEPIVFRLASVAPIQGVMVG
jgi:hypothetical protein